MTKYLLLPVAATLVLQAPFAYAFKLGKNGVETSEVCSERTPAGLPQNPTCKYTNAHGQVVDGQGNIFAPARVSGQIKVAAVQFYNPSTPTYDLSPAAVEEWKKVVREDMRKKIVEAAKAGAKLIVTPEFGTIDYPADEDGYKSLEEMAPYAEVVTLDRDATTNSSILYFSDLAAKLKVYLQIGLAEYSPVSDQYFNAALLFDDKGDLIGHHRKLELYDHEHEMLSAGTNPTIVQTPFGKIGMLICADVYNPTIKATYRKHADLLALSTSWAKEEAMRNFTDGAQEMNAPLIAANQIYFQDSGVIDSDGETQSFIKTKIIDVAYGYVKPASKLKLKPAPKPGQYWPVKVNPPPSTSRQVDPPHTRN